ncbi:MAG: hypothetical protein AAF391_00610, partial [Bacteroidota bacterium]
GRLIDTEISKRFMSILNDQSQPIDFILQQKDDHVIITSKSFASNNEYSLVINPRLEDICGNTFLNSFDYDEGTRIKDGEELVFKVKTD